MNHSIINKRYIEPRYNFYNQEITLGLSYNLYQNWWLKLEGKRKLGKLIEGQKVVTKALDKFGSNKWVSNDISMLYKGDCLKVGFGVKRDYSRKIGLKKSITIYVKIEPIFN